MKAKKIIPLVFAPAAVLFATAVMFALYGVFPFGNNTVSWCDMNQQTVPLLMDLKDILDGKSDIFYSTGNAGGMDFWGVFLFFIASPLYLTVKFTAKTDIIYLVNILLAVKLALAAFTPALYLKLVHKRLHPSFIVLLSVMYALCGYGMMYAQTLVWLDIMALFPILLLGIRKMCLEGKAALYCASLCAVMAICYYISFMLVIYILLCVPLFIFTVCSRESRKRAALLFVLSSLIAALITAPVWLCAFLQVSSSARSGSTFLEFLYKPIFESTMDKLTMLMMTALFSAVIPVFFKSHLHKKPEIRFSFIMLAALLIPVLFDPINKLWHTGSYQCFPLRYGFVIIFTMMTLTAHFLENTEGGNEKPTAMSLMTAVLAAASSALSILMVIVRKSELTNYVNYLNIDKKGFKILIGLFAPAFTVCLIGLMLYSNKRVGKKMLCLILSITFAGQFYTSFSAFLGFAVNDGDIFVSSEPLVYDSTDKPYYRAKTEKKYLHVNMLGGLGYNSLAHYTSLTSEDFMFAMKKLGYSSYWMEVGSNGGTVLTDALLGIKYSIGAYYDFASFYDIEKLPGDLERGESSICCPVGLKTKLTPSEYTELPDGSRADTQKKLAQMFFGTSDMIRTYQPDKTYNGFFSVNDDGRYEIVPSGHGSVCQLRYTINVGSRQSLYFDIFDRLSNDLSEKYYGSVQVYVNGASISSDYPAAKSNGILSLGEFSNTSVEILVLVKKNISVRSFGVFGIDTDRLKECTDRLSRTSGCEMYADGRDILAECDGQDGEYLCMSIPFEKGLTAQINGEETELMKMNDCFCAVKLRNGHNKIRLSFLPQGMKPALIMTIAGILLLIIWRLVGTERLINAKALTLPSQLIVRVLPILTVFAVYVIPMAVKLAVIFII